MTISGTPSTITPSPTSCVPFAVHFPFAQTQEGSIGIESAPHEDGDCVGACVGNCVGAFVAEAVVVDGGTVVLDGGTVIGGVDGGNVPGHEYLIP